MHCHNISALLLCSVALACFAGCTNDPSSRNSATDSGPVYATITNVYSAEDRTVYVALSDSLDTEINFDDARELSGVGNMAAIGGHLLLSSGDAPTITKYSVSAPTGWQEQGTVSFANYPIGDDNANFFYQYLVDDHHMYMPFEGSKRIVWDPTDLQILEVKKDSVLEPELDGLTLTAAGNRTGIRYDGPTMQPFFYTDEDWFDFAQNSFVAVYDPKTHEETKVIELPCAGLAIATQDEQGNTYFSTWDYSPLKALYGAAKAPCVARVTADHELDQEFTSDFTAWTGGRFSVNFRYVRDGWGLADVLHPENLKGVDFTGPVDPSLREELWSAENWRVWRIDLKNQRAEPFEGIDVGSEGWSAVHVDDRSFLFVPYQDSTRTRVYELDAEGKANTHTDLLGDASWTRVR